MNGFRKKKIAVIVPIPYRGGSLRGAKLLANAIYLGSLQDNNEIEVIFGYLDDKSTYRDEDFDDLVPEIKKRPYKWLCLDNMAAQRAFTYAGLQRRDLTADHYQVPDDGINNFLDCDLWLFVSDRVDYPLLPLKPYLLMVFDYLQRYASVLPIPSLNNQFLHHAHRAAGILVTTEATKRDALQYVGLPKAKVKKVPMLVPAFKKLKSEPTSITKPYFIWPTNIARHKNHANSLNALSLYYEKFEGNFECCITGIFSNALLSNQFKLDYLVKSRKIIASNPLLKDKLKILGELPDSAYQSHLAQAVFLWHTAINDNGTFTVVEAATFNVPALSSQYPAMQEMNKQFQLNLAWMDPDDPDDMAAQLKKMEIEADHRRSSLPSAQYLATQSIENLASAYWKEIKEYL